MWRMKGMTLVMAIYAVAGVVPEDLHDRQAVPSGVPECAAGQLEMIDQAPDAAGHRQFDLPVLRYPAGSGHRDWGLPLTLLVAPTGRVACQVIGHTFGHAPEMTDQRRQLLRDMTTWQYRPFVRDGRPASAVIEETVTEELMPRSHRDMPTVPLDQVTLSLERTGCFGTCPGYIVRIHGDGTVEYRGDESVDITGKHTYRIPVGKVAALVEDLRRADLWSMESSYRTPVTDNATYLLTLKLGDRVHEIEDYVGGQAGMPRAVSRFEDEMDRVARTSEWTQLSTFAVEQLHREGFDFRSAAAADMLARAVANDDGRDERAMLQMIAAGTPVTGGNALDWRRPPGTRVRPSLLEGALIHHRAMLIDPLLAAGALRTGAALDHQKVDAAFRDAIEGGRLSLVQKVWSLTTPGARPSLWFTDKDDEGHAHRTPVTLLLSRRPSDHGWEGMAIAQWLAGMGCDLEAHAANGDTLLHRAVDAGDITFVRYLLAHGLIPSTPGNFGLPALGSAKDEDIALLLLQAGSDWHMGDHGESFLRYARDMHWGRVLAWLQRQRR